jgi:hypothetical protein
MTTDSAPPPNPYNHWQRMSVGHWKRDSYAIHQLPPSPDDRHARPMFIVYWSNGDIRTDIGGSRLLSHAKQIASIHRRAQQKLAVNHIEPPGTRGPGYVHADEEDLKIWEGDQ